MSVALVTGAARGLGAAIARAASAAGHRAALLDVDLDGARAVASELDGAIALAADTTDERSLERALDALGEPPALVVANAGIVRFGPLLDLDPAAWRAVVEVNLTGTFLTLRAAARRMIAARSGGAMVAVTSINGVMPGPNAGAYGATKAAIALLVQQCALEWAAHGIRVNAVAPGMIDGGMSAPIFADPEFRALRTAKVPLGRLGTEEDVANAVLFLASPAASYVTGQNLVVDGGVTTSIIANLPRPASVDAVGKGEARP